MYQFVEGVDFLQNLWSCLPNRASIDAMLLKFYQALAHYITSEPVERICNQSDKICVKAVFSNQIFFKLRPQLTLIALSISINFHAFCK